MLSTVFRQIAAARLLTLALVAVFLITAIANAFAQESTKVDFTPLWNALVPGIAALLSAVLALILARLNSALKEKTGIDLQSQHMAALNAAITNGVNLALSKIKPAEGQWTVDVKSKIAADALTYVVRAAPDAISHFGLDDKMAHLKDMIAAKLQVALPGPNA